MARWLVQLSGERMDLEEFPRNFPVGNVFAVEENETFYLVGPEFEARADVDAVQREANYALDLDGVRRV